MDQGGNGSLQRPWSSQYTALMELQAWEPCESRAQRDSEWWRWWWIWWWCQPNMSRDDTTSCKESTRAPAQRLQASPGGHLDAMRSCDQWQLLQHLLQGLLQHNTMYIRPLIATLCTIYDHLLRTHDQHDLPSLGWVDPANSIDNKSPIQLGNTTLLDLARIFNLLWHQRLLNEHGSLSLPISTIYHTCWSWSGCLTLDAIVQILLMSCT